MRKLLERFFATLLNRFSAWRGRAVFTHGLRLGCLVADGGVSEKPVTIPHSRRAEHIAILGRTGTGKSSLIRFLSGQDINARRGFIFFDLHGDATPTLLSLIAEKEKREGGDLSDRVIVINPADCEYSVGFNPLGSEAGSFIENVRFAEILKHRWNLQSFGARTDELLRNAICVLSENGLTIVETLPLLSNDSFRAACLKRVKNSEVRHYFEERYDKASPQMQAVMREPILNKVTAFTADPHFRHIVGQAKSTFSLLEAMDAGKWVILNLHKGRLGEEALTLGGLFLTTIKNVLFSRKKRELFTLYADEVQNLIALGSDIETMLSEARKFGVSLVTANQFLDQYPLQMRSAILAVGTHLFFRLSSADAQCISGALDGGRSLSELLKNLPQRHLVVKSGSEHWREAAVPELKRPTTSFSSLYERSRRRWARPRSDVETEIAARLTKAYASPKEFLDAWE